MNYYPHHIGDFNSATRHLTRLERSIYRDLIDLYYDTEEPLTLDLNALCRLIIARSDEERTAVQQVLNEFFTETERGWSHARCEIEIAKYHGNKEAKSAAGKASAAKRAQKSQQPLSSRSTRVSTAVEQVLPARSTNQEPEPITKNQEPEENISLAQAQAPVAEPAPVRPSPKPAAKPKGKGNQPEKFPLPAGFEISDAVRAWAERHGHTHLQTHFDHFVGTAIAKGYTYANWDQALMNAIRDDWAKLKERPRTRQAYGADRTQAEIDAFVNGPSSYDGNVIDMEVRRVGF